MIAMPRWSLMARRRGAPAVALVLLILAGAPALAQTMTNNFGGFSQNSGEPIDIESDVLVVHDAKKYATFKGNVKAVQGTTTLRARELDVHYVGGGGDTLTGGAPSQGAAQPAAGVGLGEESGTQISQIEARGSVIINSEKDQTTTGDWALYDVPTQIVSVGGNVVLTQGKNVLKGDRLIIDLKTGESRFENQDRTVAGGRIRALFVPKEQEAKAAKKDKDEAAEPGFGEAESAAAENVEDPEKAEKAAEKAAKKAEKKATGGEWDRDPNSLR